MKPELLTDAQIEDLVGPGQVFNVRLVEALTNAKWQSMLEQQEPFGHFHELINSNGGIWLGCTGENSKSICEKAYTEGETGKEVIPLYKYPVSTKQVCKEPFDPRMAVARLLIYANRLEEVETISTNPNWQEVKEAFELLVKYVSESHKMCSENSVDY